jgi:prepilin-type N-terminal cleavage/methylation domain-containing protein
MRVFHLERGFSLLEIMVAMVIMAMVTVAMLTFFDTANKLTQTQSGIAEMQSSQRVAQQELVRMIGMAGIGGLPEGMNPASPSVQPNMVFPLGLAMSVQNNVAGGTLIGDAGSAAVVAGTDILTLRGVYTTDMLFIVPAAPLTLDVNGATSLVLSSTVDAGVIQQLDELRGALNDKDAIIVYDSFNPEAYAVLELDLGGSLLGVLGAPQMTLRLLLGATSTYGREYGLMVLGTTLLQGSGGQLFELPGAPITQVQLPRTVGAIGILEEFRYFVRSDFSIASDNTSLAMPVLTRARFQPNTNDPYPVAAVASVDLADWIADLQVAIGVDLATVANVFTGQMEVDGQLLEIGLAMDDDEVLFNFPGESNVNVLGTTWANPNAQIMSTRVTTAALTGRWDHHFAGATFAVVEDNQYNAASLFNTSQYRIMRKRILQTTVEMRNLP